MEGSASWKRFILAAFIFCLFPQSWANKIIELTVNGSIGPATADYLARSIEKGQNASLILITLDTPGGLEKSTHQIVQSILLSKVPIVVFVAPTGARAASAGTFLLYASTVAAMAPGTHLGAASPINLTSVMNEARDNKKSIMDKKVINDATANIRSLAQLRGRDLSFAEKAVLDAATLTASEALKAGVINLIAEDRQQLLIQLDGKTVTQAGKQISLATKNLEVEALATDWRVRFLQAITDPTVAYFLLLLGVYGIFFELINPGFVLPGVVGGIAILVALYALQLLPINYAGLSLIILGFAFIVAEAFTASFGILGLGGTLAFVIGSILLIDTDNKSYQIASSAILAMAIINILVFLALLTLVIKSRKRRMQHGVAFLIGSEGRAVGTINPYGQAVIKGEIWNVRAKHAIAPNQRIKVIDAQGLQLEVEEIKSSD